MVVENDRAAAEAARLEVEPNMMPAVGQDRMFKAIGIDGKREPRRQLVRMDSIVVARICRHGDDAQRAGVEFGTPDNPRLRRRQLRTFGESESPTGQGRR